MESIDAADMFRDIGEPRAYNITAQYDVGTRHSLIYSLRFNGHYPGGPGLVHTIMYLT